MQILYKPEQPRDDAQMQMLYTAISTICGVVLLSLPSALSLAPQVRLQSLPKVTLTQSPQVPETGLESRSETRPSGSALSGEAQNLHICFQESRKH